MPPEQLSTWLGDTQVGSLERDRKGFRFRSEEGAKALTASAEGTESPWPRVFARNWFDGLLPDDAQRTYAENAHGVARGDTFGLLAAIGWECAGAVSVMPPGNEPATGSYLSLSEDELWSRLDALPAHPFDIDRKVRMSLGGAQEKLLLFRSPSGAWSLPLEGAVSTHILKPEPRPYPGLAIAEAYCLNAAADVTPTAEAELLLAKGHRPTLVVKRFDRRGALDGGLVRIHQEDGCQVLGLPPTLKYAEQPSDGYPSLAKIAGVLLSRAGDPATELRRFLQQLTLNIALGNLDAHAKNYSVQHRDGVVTLSPLYDVVPTRPFIPTDRRAAMFVGGKIVFDDITRGHLLAEARSWGIPERIARETIADTLDRLDQGIARGDQSFPALADEVRTAIRRQYDVLCSSPW